MVEEFIIIGNLSSNSWITDKSRALEKKEEKQRERERDAGEICNVRLARKRRKAQDHPLSTDPRKEEWFSRSHVENVSPCTLV